MSKYRNKSSGVLITDYEYYKMSYSEQQNYRKVEENSSEDFLTSAVVSAVTDSAIVGTIVGGSITGALLGDILDGDLMD